jgi:DNA-binding MarR family transcriptional regulator
LDEAEDQAWRGFRRMVGLLDLQIYRDLAEDSGLSEPDYDVLSTLSETPGQIYRVNRLADRLLWSRSRLSHHLTRMEQRGLVQRSTSASDGRGSTVTLTRAGKRALEAAAPGHVESVRANLIDLLTRQELATLERISRKVVDRLTATSREDSGRVTRDG